MRWHIGMGKLYERRIPFWVVGSVLLVLGMGCANEADTDHYTNEQDGNDTPKHFSHVTEGLDVTASALVAHGLEGPGVYIKLFQYLLLTPGQFYEPFRGHGLHRES